MRQNRQRNFSLIIYNFSRRTKKPTPPTMQRSFKNDRW